MLEVNSNIIADDTCNCGRPKDRRHCPRCGHINFYALKHLRSKRPHPQTGEMTDIKTFRCRSCDTHFDDLQWQYDCKAPRSIRAQQQENREITKESLLRQAESGVHFTENDKRHFYKYVKIPYNEYMKMWNRNKALKDKKALEQAERMAAVKAPTIKESALTPLQYHIENCNYCNTHDDNCEIAKQLQVAEGMKQP
jgi:hypothetical protein